MENPNGNVNNDYEHDNMSQSTHMHQIEKKKVNHGIKTEFQHS